MKLYPLTSTVYHMFQKSFFETVLYDDDFHICCYGTPNLVNQFITKNFSKSWTIFFYHNRKDGFTYEMNSSYIGEKIAEIRSEEAKEKQTEKATTPKQSERKPS